MVFPFDERERSREAEGDLVSAEKERLLVASAAPWVGTDCDDTDPLRLGLRSATSCFKRIPLMPGSLPRFSWGDVDRRWWLSPPSTWRVGDTLWSPSVPCIVSAAAGNDTHIIIRSRCVEEIGCAM